MLDQHKLLHIREVQNANEFRLTWTEWKVTFNQVLPLIISFNLGQEFDWAILKHHHAGSNTSYFNSGHMSRVKMESDPQPMSQVFSFLPRL